MAGEVDIGSLVAKIGGDTSGLKKSLDKSKSMMDKATSSMSNAVNNMVKSLFSWKSALAVVAGATGLGYFAMKCLDAADKIGKVSDSIGISTSALQEYRYAAKLSGVSTEGLDRALRFFSHNIADLKVGVGEMATRLKESNSQLLEQLKNSNSTTEALDMLFDAMGDATSQSERMTLAYAGFSRQGMQMINMLRGGKEGLHEMREEAVRYGMVIDEKLIRQSEIANDRLSRLTTSIKMKLVASVAEAAPQIQNLFEGMQTVIDHVLQRMNELSKDGSLARWAKSIALSVAQSFKLIVWSVEQVAKAIDVVKIGYAALLELSLPYKLASVNKELVETQKQLDEAWEGKWVKDAESKRKLISELENRIIALRNEKHEYSNQLKAARSMGKDAIRDLEETKSAFDSVIKEIEGIVIAIEATGSASEKTSESIKKMMNYVNSNPSTTVEIGGISGYETFFEYYRSILNEQDDVISNLDINMNKLADDYIKQLELVEKQREEWQSITSDIGESFTDALIGGADKFGENFRKMFDNIVDDIAKKFAEKTFTKPLQEQMDKLFGPGGKLDVEVGGIFAEGTTWNDVIGAGVTGLSGINSISQQYNAGTLTGFGGLETGAMSGAALGSLFGPMGTGIGAAVGGIGGLLAGVFGKDKPSLHDLISEQVFDDLSNSLSGSIGQGFTDALNSGDYQSFVTTVGSGLKNMVADAMKEVFVAQAMQPLMDIFQPMFDKIADAEYQQEAGAWDKWAANQIYHGFGAMLNPNRPVPLVLQPDITPEQIAAEAPTQDAIDQYFDQMRPLFDAFSGIIDELNNALGLNTDAITSNTDAIMGPVNSFLMSLDTGPLAPSQSLAGLANIESSLYTAALADPSQFAAYASFMTGTQLPTMQGLSMDNGMDYQDYVSGVKSGVMDIPWVAQNMNTPSAQSIGYEVGNALAPMLLDLKESGKITVNVVVDGEVVKSAVVDALGDRDVVAQIQDM